MAISTREVLLTTEEVANRQRTKGVRILEVDEDTEAYQRGHLPGAVAVHWKKDLQDPIRRDFIGPASFASLMDRIGIGNDSEVILYGRQQQLVRRLRLLDFKYYGHQKVQPDGRRPQEVGAGEARDDHRAPSDAAPGYRYQTAPRSRDSRASATMEALRWSGSGTTLVDVRSPEEFPASCSPRRTFRRTGAAAGPHPGRRNIPWARP